MTRSVLLALVLIACSGDGADDSTPTTTSPGSTSTTPTAAAVDCSDPSENPFAGTCVETFMAACFDPTGTCDGTVDMMGNTELVWASGATVTTQTDFSNPLNPSVITTLTASDGTECATGITDVNEGGCASRTTYTRTSDGAQQVYCIQLDGSMTVTCDNATVIEVPANQGGAAEQCQYGDAGPCTITGP